ANFSARPPNDDFGSAQIVSGSSGTANGNNVGGSKETGEPSHGGNSGGTSIWYKWTAPATGQVIFDTFQSGFDTLLAIYTGNTLGGLTLIAGNDDAATGGTQSSVTFNAVAGVTYLIAIDGYNGASGATALHWLLTQQSFTISLTASPVNAGIVSGAGSFTAGTSQTVTATPNSGFSFNNWTENGSIVSNSASYTFTLNGNRNLVANFIANQVIYVIATNSSPANGGTTSGGGSYAAGSLVTVAAAASNGFSFVNWTQNGSVVSTSANYAFTAAANRTLTANFSSKQYNIGVSASPPNGGIVTGAGNYVSGSNVTVTATPNPGFLFANWTQNGTVVSTTSSYSFPAIADRALVANFTSVFTIATSAQPPNGGATTGGGNFSGGTSATVIALPNNGFNFVNWTENGVQVSASDSYTFTVNGSRSLVANFASKPGNNDFAAPQQIAGNSGTAAGGNLNATKEPAEPAHAANIGGASIWYAWTPTISGPATIDTLQSSFDTLLAVYMGNDLSLLTEVASNDDVAGGLQSRVTFNATAGVTYRIAVDGYNGATGTTAVHWLLGQPTFTIGLSAFPGGSGNVSGAGAFAAGSSRTVVATPNPGFLFANWTENGTIVSTSASYTFTLNGDRTLVANFVAGVTNYTIALRVAPVGRGSAIGAGTFEAGSIRTVRASPARRYSFRSWTENGVIVSTSPTYTFTLDRNRSLVANFARGRRR
ncbi:MAG TPA: hypothetical protein VJ719_14690, partial [Chthoniobacterales bacterium]|nr:hypothetical protein [Chthoniobacterales bacterium]